jgi:hypothetical protein
MAARRTTKAVAEATGAGPASKAATGRGRKAANGNAAKAEPKADTTIVEVDGTKVAETTKVDAPAKAKGQAPRKPATNGVKAVGKAPKGYAAAKKAEAAAVTPEPAQDDDAAKRARVEELSAQINALLAEGNAGETDREARKADREAARIEREAAREARKAEREARRNSPERTAQASWRTLIGLAKQFRASSSDEELRKLLVVRVRTAFEEWLAAEDDVVEAREVDEDEVDEKVAA